MELGSRVAKLQVIWGFLKIRGPNGGEIRGKRSWNVGQLEVPFEGPYNREYSKWVEKGGPQTLNPKPKKILFGEFGDGLGFRVGDPRGVWG